ncbi:MAG TPA: 4-alpha-glucanotransferase [Methylotenera sp.]|nr:4-alpha-glucanotransferase [Methylotenera sp.]HPH04805.1 4-alpha-glucanotransferase [Methylotenera sp.]HPN01572.1 4-alpha-glucanotransferase [Methylotenera sp.]
MIKVAKKSPLSQRRAGVLLHISSLPNKGAVGDLGAEAYRFVDFLHEIGASVWQTLPINAPHADNSPYQALSAFAGNPDFISIEALQAQGLLLRKADANANMSKSQLLANAYEAFKIRVQKKEQLAFTRFCKKQAHWLDDFALFLALKNKHNQAGWQFWPEAYKNRDVDALKFARKELAFEIATIQFTQFIFFTQWAALKAYAAKKKVYLFGDIPIFVAYDSADVWANPHLFKLDANKNMAVVAGVPPDYFSATGQRWGNPHYDWQAMASDNYHWWVQRMATQSALFDIVRIDHFRGLEAAWEIPAHEDTAINGQWVLAPGDALLAAITDALPNICLVAEDLGIITDEVNALRNQYHLPGMKILQFAFGGSEDNPYLPENIEENSVVYTGTHDNDTTLGWFNNLDAQQREHLYAYLQKKHPHQTVKMPQDLTNLALSTLANLAIIPMQDILHLDGAHRMNTPGTCEGNWHWRFSWKQLKPNLQADITQAIQQAGRH